MMPMQQGWLCPRCQRVNAPTTPACFCPPEMKAPPPMAPFAPGSAADVPQTPMFRSVAQSTAAPDFQVRRASPVPDASQVIIENEPIDAGDGVSGD